MIDHHLTTTLEPYSYTCTCSCVRTVWRNETHATVTSLTLRSSAPHTCGNYGTRLVLLSTSIKCSFAAHCTRLPVPGVTLLKLVEMAPGPGGGWHPSRRLSMPVAATLGACLRRSGRHCLLNPNSTGCECSSCSPPRTPVACLRDHTVFSPKVRAAGFPTTPPSPLIIPAE